MEYIKNDQDEIKACVWTPLENIEKSALAQIHNMIKHPRLFKHIAIMPDVHAGIGATIGSVIPLKNAIIPSAVGVDIACGMCAVKTNISLESIRPHFSKIYDQILKRIPLGFSHRSDQQLNDVHNYVIPALLHEIKLYEQDSRWNQNKIINQLGTLGGGNHFIELQVDPDDNIWIMLHSGSRNIGNKIATTYIQLAKTVNSARSLQVAPDDLEYFEADSAFGIQYIKHSRFATDFAFNNRLIMVEIIKDILNKILGPNQYETMINIHHNYVNQEFHFNEMVWVHRKGATKVMSRITGIIPGSMGSASYIVQGTDNADSFNSCSHGAGRIMSRTSAKGKFDRKKKIFKTDGQLSIDDFKNDMQNIFTNTVDREHIDEAPRAYKNIDEVMKNQIDLVNIKTRLLPVLNVKG